MSYSGNGKILVRTGASYSGSRSILSSSCNGKLLVWLRESSGSVVECLTGVRGITASWSLSKTHLS